MKVLIFCLPGIGDALMATPMIKLLKKKLPYAQIDIACMFEGVRYIFKNNHNINNIYKLYLYNENIISGLKQTLSLRNNRYDVSILAFPAFRREYHITHWLAGAKKRIAHQFKSGFWEEFNFLNTNLVPVDETKHNLINNLNLLDELDINWNKEMAQDNLYYDLVLNKKDRGFGHQFINELRWHKEDIIGIHPGSTTSPAALFRRWPIERYAQLVKYLINQKKKKVLIFIGPDEIDLGEKLYQLISDKTDCRLISNLKFNQAVGLLSQVKLLICNDNGFGHLANALNIPIITLWASTNDRWSLPYNKKLVILIRPKKFRSWYSYDLKRTIPKGAESGMELVTINQVTDAINKILK